MTDVKWIKLSTHFFENLRIKLLLKEENASDLILFWIRLLILAGQQNNHGQFVMENGKIFTPEILSTAFDCDIELTEKALQLFLEYSMIIEKKGVLCIKNWDEYQDLDALERKREAARAAQKKYRDRIKERDTEQASACDDNGDISVISRYATDKIREEESREDKKRGEKTRTENKEKSKKEKFSFSEFAGGNAELLEALEAFEAMRKTIRKPMTDRAKEMLCAELKKYPGTQWVPMLNQAVLNSWQSVYPLKKTGPGSSKAAAELEDFYAMTADWAGGDIHDEQ